MAKLQDREEKENRKEKGRRGSKETGK